MKHLVLLAFISLSILLAGCDNNSEVPQPMTWEVAATGDGVSVRYNPEEYPQIHISADYAAGEVTMVCTNRNTLRFGFFNNPRSTGYDFGFGDASIEGDTVVIHFGEDNAGGEARSCRILISSEGEAQTAVAVTRTFTEMQTQRTSGM